MIAWVFGMPVILLVMVLALDRLEARVIAPAERVVKITKLMESSPPEVVEHQVAVLLASAIERPSNAVRAS